jgi:hypothetical protein
LILAELWQVTKPRLDICAPQPAGASHAPHQRHRRRNKHYEPDRIVENGATKRCIRSGEHHEFRRNGSNTTRRWRDGISRRKSHVRVPGING